MNNRSVVIITGANRGIGRAIVQTLASSSSTPLIVYATSRGGDDIGFQVSSNIKVKYSKLDIANPTSIKAFSKMVKDSHGAIDVLINNAAAHDADKTYTPEVVSMVLETNIWGTLHMCEAFIPLLSDRGRIVNISSTDSSLANYGQELQKQFRNPSLNLHDLEAMIQQYQACVKSGTEKQEGWPQSAYSVSKAGINALTKILARGNPRLFINCCCPGWVNTDMGTIAGSRPPKTPQEGAKIPIRLGFGGIDGVTGKYWGNPSVFDTGDGEVQEW